MTYGECSLLIWTATCTTESKDTTTHYVSAHYVWVPLRAMGNQPCMNGSAV